MIHAAAIVHESVRLGQDVAVWQFSHVMSGTVIGDHSSIGGGAEIGHDCLIGASVRIGFGVFLPNHTIVEDDVFIGPRVVACDDKHPKVNNPRYRAQPPVFRRGCNIGAGAVILPGVEIGEGATVGAGAVVTKSVESFMVVVGNPAKELVR